MSNNIFPISVLYKSDKQAESHVYLFRFNKIRGKVHFQVKSGWDESWQSTLLLEDILPEVNHLLLESWNGSTFWARLYSGIAVYLLTEATLLQDALQSIEAAPIKSVSFLIDALKESKNMFPIVERQFKAIQLSIDCPWG